MLTVGQDDTLPLHDLESGAAGGGARNLIARKILPIVRSRRRRRKRGRPRSTTVERCRVVRAPLLGRRDGCPDATAWRLLAFSGMRRGEALALRWRDLDVEARQVSIRRSVGLVGTKGKGFMGLM
jgi:integrase